jgi:hypothetical protein
LQDSPFKNCSIIAGDFRVDGIHARIRRGTECTTAAKISETTRSQYGCPNFAANGRIVVRLRRNCSNVIGRPERVGHFTSSACVASSSGPSGDRDESSQPCF